MIDIFIILSPILARKRCRGFIPGLFILGSDDGDYNTFASSGFKKNAVFYILDRNTGKIIDKVENVAGDIRSTAVFHKEHLYFTTKGGELWKVRISDEGKVLDTH